MSIKQYLVTAILPMGNYAELLDLETKKIYYYKFPIDKPILQDEHFKVHKVIGLVDMKPHPRLLEEK